MRPVNAIWCCQCVCGFRYADDMFRNGLFAAASADGWSRRAALISLNRCSHAANPFGSSICMQAQHPYELTSMVLRVTHGVHDEFQSRHPPPGVCWLQRRFRCQLQNIRTGIATGPVEIAKQFRTRVSSGQHAAVAELLDSERFWRREAFSAWAA